MAERTPHDRETLIFPKPEAAQQFRERVESRLQRERKSHAISKREVISQEVAAEFEREDEIPGSLKQPWEHSSAEHDEVQQLVNTAFAQDLSSALRKARKSPHYPRNLDLLHDVITGEMYALMAQHKLQRQPVAIWVVAMGGIVVLAVLLSVLAFVT